MEDAYADVYGGEGVGGGSGGSGSGGSGGSGGGGGNPATMLSSGKWVSPPMWEEASSMGGFVAHVRAMQWRRAGLRKEAIFIAQCLDEIVKEGAVPGESKTMERLARRLCSIQCMELGYKSSVADSISFDFADSRGVPTFALVDSLKTAKLVDSLQTRRGGPKRGQWHGDRGGGGRSGDRASFRKATGGGTKGKGDPPRGT